MIVILPLGPSAQKVLSSQEAPEEVATTMIQVGDIDIAYKVFGEGDPLLLIMGYSGTMDLWATEMLKELASKYQVITFDNRGMGQTTASDKEFTIELFADDTRGLLDALGIERAYVLGWSLGTYIAQELALRCPDKVEKLILYAGDCGGKEAIYPSAEILDILGDTSASSPERGKKLLATLFPQEWLEEHPNPRTYFPEVTETSSPENIKRQYQAWQNWKGTYSRLAKITQPTLLITGADDINTPWQNSLIMVDLIPGAWLVQLEGGGHGVMYQYPKKFSRILFTFLAS
jgi:pimeloyl-ACP methyl ester carboxylesterase